MFFLYFCIMQNIFSHIAYLLTKHECVIIPGFGALIHTPVSSKNADENVFSPPGISLGFNSELNHNDGILADSVKREQKVSYNEANKIVSDFSVQFIDLLKNKKEVSIPQVGYFGLSEDNKINFSPATVLSANAGQYGFKNFYLPLLIDIATPTVTKEAEGSNNNKRSTTIPLRKRLLTAASVAAVALIFLLLSTPINNKEIPAQYAGMFSSYIQEPVSFITNVPDSLISENIMNEDSISTEMPVQVSEDTLKTTAVIEEEVEKEIVPEVKPFSANGYLIIIASFPNKRDAEKRLSQLKKEFNTASIIEKSDRSRIYIRSFEDKEEAEYFLNKFRKDNPKYKDAWLLSNKVRS